MHGQVDTPRVIVKVGGSLYDYPPLRTRLNRFLDSLESTQVAVFPGGGPFANVIRQLEVLHGKSEERSHWLAVRSLGLAARFLAGLLEPRSAVVSTAGEWETTFAGGQIGVIDPERFARVDVRRKDALPRTWEVTSDSLALQLARRWRAGRLILLKSVTAPQDWPSTSASGIVDPWFSRLLADTDKRVGVSIVNLRQEKMD